MHIQNIKKEVQNYKIDLNIKHNINIKNEEYSFKIL